MNEHITTIKQYFANLIKILQKFFLLIFFHSHSNILLPWLFIFFIFMASTFIVWFFIQNLMRQCVSCAIYTLTLLLVILMSHYSLTLTSYSFNFGFIAFIVK